MNSVPEIRREKVFIPPEMTAQEITEKYGLKKEGHGSQGRRVFSLRTTPGNR